MDRRNAGTLIDLVPRMRVKEAAALEKGGPSPAQVFVAPCDYVGHNIDRQA